MTGPQAAWLVVAVAGVVFITAAGATIRRRVKRRRQVLRQIDLAFARLPVDEQLRRLDWHGQVKAARGREELTRRPGVHRQRRGGRR